MATFRVNGPTHLLQTFRLAHAMAESGHTIQILPSDQPQWEVLKHNFGTSFEVGNSATAVDVTLDHAKPATGVGNVTRPLVFAKSVADKCKSLWVERQVKFVFTGTPTPQQQQVLNNWSSHGLPSMADQAWPQKAWDQDSFAAMAKAEFALCPQSDVGWTYRFYEAALCGAIPVVEERLPSHAGYATRLLSDNHFEWSEQEALSNYALAVSQLVVNPDELSDLISDALGEPRPQRAAAAKPDEAFTALKELVEHAEREGLYEAPAPVKKAAAKKPAAKKRPGRPRKR